MSNVANIIDEINEKFISEHWLDFEIVSLVNGILKIKASIDFYYYHNMEITLIDVVYFQGVMEWRTSPNKRKLIEILSYTEMVEQSDVYKFSGGRYGFSFDNDDGCKNIFVANEIIVNYDTVYYYLRSDLLENERIDVDILRGSVEKDV